MQKELLQTIKKIKKWAARQKVLDAVLFGSAMRGKAAPRDLDLCILIEDKDEEKSIDLADSLGSFLEKLSLKPHISVITSSAATSGNTLIKTLLNEGYSVTKNKSFSSIFGFESKSLFVYTLKKFTSSKRVQFHYMLRGRYGTKGMLKEMQGIILGTGTILVPTEKEDLLKEILDRWNVKYEIKRALFG